jgi:hypothetical protein
MKGNPVLCLHFLRKWLGQWLLGVVTTILPLWKILDAEKVINEHKKAYSSVFSG